MEVDLGLNFTWSGNLWSHDQRVMENDIISHWHHSQPCDFPCFPGPFLVCSQSEVIWKSSKQSKPISVFGLITFFLASPSTCLLLRPPAPQGEYIQNKLGQGSEQIGARQLSHCVGLPYHKYYSPTSNLLSLASNLKNPSYLHSAMCTAILHDVMWSALLFSSVGEGCFEVSMHPEEYPPRKATCKLHIDYYVPVLSNYICAHTAAPRISANADLPTTLSV